MRINLNKSTKRALSLVLAFAMLLGSLFVANVGVNIDTRAETVEKKTETWDGTTKPTKLADSGMTGSGTPESPYIVSTPAQLYYVAIQSGADSAGKYYEVDSNVAVFNMNSSGFGYSGTAFQGSFNGNGVEIVNFKTGGWHSGLFPLVSGNVTIENVEITGATVESSGGEAGGFVGNTSGTTSLNIKNCMITKSTIKGKGRAGAIIGSVGAQPLTVDNCFVADNTVVSSVDKGYSDYTNSDGTQTFADETAFRKEYPNNAVVGYGYTSTRILKNSIVIGNDPNARVSSAENVYTDQDVTLSGITKLTTDAMTGDAAMTNMSLDFSGVWFANKTTYPVLRVFHNFKATNNNDGTHQEECTDCELVGLTANHFYNIIDDVYKKSYCACGAWIDGIFDVWDSEGATADGYAGGSGTEADPYIIKTVEQLFKMVCEAGEDADGKPQYYKVADGVTALYINDTRSLTFDDFKSAAAADSLNNWSEKIPTGFCDSCSHTKPATLTLFNGYFDGNGATIYGLYSKTTSTNSWVNGTGFVPGMVRNSVIKNVVFDTSYVKSSAESAAVVCSSFGLSSADAHVNAGYCCDDSEEMLIYTATPSLIGIAVRNAHVESKSSMPDADTDGDGNADNVYSFSAGITANYAAPKTLKIQHCLFDGTNSTLVSDTGTDSYAKRTSGGMFASTAGWVYTYVDSCLSIGVDVSDKAENISAVGSYSTSADAVSVNIATDYKSASDLPLLNWTAWDIDAVDTYGTPMPKLFDGWEYEDFRYYKDAYKNSEYYNNPEGASAHDNGYDEGIFSDYDELIGSGTEADPYIIDNAELLFEIIASGGTNRGIPQHYKLVCDIDLDGIQWVNYQTDADRNDAYSIVYYDYRAFAGIIDGDGHTVTGMYNANANQGQYAGFIPELTATGVVKNLHFRDSYAYAEDGYGIVAGNAESGAKIIGCSVEGGVADKLVGSDSATVTDSYCGSEVTVSNDSLFDGTNYDTAVWYKGGEEGDTYKLLNKALAMPCADIDGDGDGYEYDADDIVALKHKLLKNPDYANIYGDVSRNGKTDIRDMVVLQKEAATDVEVRVFDGFWNNAKAGNFKIWYDKNDNYDFARKIQLYLKETTGVDVDKKLGTTTENLTIRIVTDSSLGNNNYSVTYVLETGVLTISGGSFTAVEQGVLAFVDGSNVATGDIYQGSGEIDGYKNAVSVGSDTYHYVWGDEFDSDVNGTVSYDKWLLRNKTTDETPGTADSEFEGIRAATDAEAPLINAVADDALYLKRGILESKDSEGYSYYASGISSLNSMLYKRGYAEMLVTLPSDGFAFPAWWLLTRPAYSSNAGISRSLYGKVYELNNSGDYQFDKQTNFLNAADPTTFQYKLPAQTLEIDIFEIIQKPSYSYPSVTASTNYDVSFNIHKWYSNGTVKPADNDVKSGDVLTVYDLDWDNLANNNGSFGKLLTATYSEGGIWASEGFAVGDGDIANIKYNEGNLLGGQVNGSVTYEGGHDNTSVDPKTDSDSMKVNMSTYRTSGQVKQLKYGFLWTEDEMTFSIYDGDTKLHSATVELSELAFNNKEDWSAEQYAYMLIENHWYTATYSSNAWRVVNNNSISSCDMVIDYVRLYQLEGQRDIVTPETEAFNSNNRFGN